MYLSNKIHPLRILKWKLLPVFILIVLIPTFLINNQYLVDGEDSLNVYLK